MTIEEVISQLRYLGKIHTRNVQELSVKVESLEHLSNQHDILLMSLLSGMSPKDVFKRLSGSIDEKPEST